MMSFPAICVFAFARALPSIAGTMASAVGTPASNTSQTPAATAAETPAASATDTVAASAAEMLAARISEFHAASRIEMPAAGTADMVAASAAEKPAVSAASQARAAEYPEEFKCPISQELMSDPVITADGHSFDRACIERWLRCHGTSPVTNLSLPSKALVPNHALRSQMQRGGLEVAPLERAAPREGGGEEGRPEGVEDIADVAQNMVEIEVEIDEGDSEDDEGDGEEEEDEDVAFDEEEASWLEQILCTDCSSADESDFQVRRHRRASGAKAKAKTKAKAKGKAKAKAKAKVRAKAKAKPRAKASAARR